MNSVKAGFAIARSYPGRRATVGVVIIFCVTGISVHAQNAPGAREFRQSYRVASPEQSPVAACSKARCEIRMQRVSVLSDSIDLGLLPDVPVVQQDGRGRFFMPVRTMDGIAVFDSSGKFIKRIGRHGAGPGEFARVAGLLPGPGDSIYAFDHALQRISVISPTFEIVRQYKLTHQPSLILSGGRHVVAAQVGTIEASGLPLHVMTEAGRIERSFGADTAQHRADLWLITTRVVGRGLPHGVWAAAPGRYVLELWNTQTGTRSKAVTVRSSWFTESIYYNNDETKPPTPIITGVWQDDPLFVWVLFRVPDEKWRRPVLANTERPMNMERNSQSFDSILEAIDVGSGAVLASIRLSSLHIYRSPTALLATTRFLPGGVYAYELWRPQLITKEAR